MNKIINTQCSCFDGEFIWMFHEKFNALYKYSINSENLIYVDSNPNESFFVNTLYNECLYYKEKIYFFPVHAKGIAIYDIKNATYINADIPKREGICYYNVIQISTGEVLLFPVIYSNYAYIIKLDSMKFEVIELDFGIYGERISKDYIRGNALVNENAIFATDNAKVNIIFNTTTNCLMMEDTIEKERFFITTSQLDDAYIMHSSGTRLIKRTGESIETIYLCEKSNSEICVSNMSYICVKSFVGGIMCFPYKAKSLKMVIGGKIIDMGFESDAEQPFCEMIQVNQLLYLLPYRGDSMMIIDLNSYMVRLTKLVIPEKEWKKTLAKQDEILFSCINEGEYIDLQEWVTII